MKAHLEASWIAVYAEARMIRMIVISVKPARSGTVLKCQSPLKVRGACTCSRVALNSSRRAKRRCTDDDPTAVGRKRLRSSFSSRDGKLVPRRRQRGTRGMCWQRPARAWATGSRQLQAPTSELDGDAAEDVDEGDGEEVAGDGAHHGNDGVAGGGLVDLLVDGRRARAGAARGVVEEDLLRGRRCVAVRCEAPDWGANVIDKVANVIGQLLGNVVPRRREQGLPGTLLLSGSFASLPAVGAQTSPFARDG